MLFERTKRIVIAGVGLIGGSFGMALKKAGFHGEIVGLVRREEAIKEVKDAGAVDWATLDFRKALTDANLLLIATPVDKIAGIAEEAIKYAPNGCIFVDVGSTKRQIVSEIEKFMPEDMYFVGSHPMAGSHKMGISAARASLFQNSICIITPIESSNSEAIELVSQMWTMVGAQIRYMSLEEHDYLIAAASHLPHAVSRALVQTVGEIECNGKKAIEYTGKGFADMTRLASASIENWKDIFLQNADMLSIMMDALEREIAEIRKIIDNRDAEKLLEKLKQAKSIRDSV